MPYKKTLLVGLSILFSLVQLFFARSSFAASNYQTIDTASAINPSFTAGYTQKSFAESFHREADAPLELERELDAWKIYKGFNFSSTYDTNIFLTRKSHNADLIFNYTPTIGLARKTEIGTLGLAYDLSYVDYTDNDDLDRFNHSINTIAGLNLDRNGKKLKIGFSNNFKPDTAYQVGERTEFHAAESDRVITYSDNAALRASYELSPKTTFSLDQGLNIYYFPDEDNKASVNSLSTRTYTVTPGVSYKITPKVSLGGYYSYEYTDYYERKGRFDSSANVVGGTVSGQINPKTNVSLGLDYRVHDYQDTLINGSDSIEWKAAVSRKLTEKLQATLWASRSLGENLDYQQNSSVYETQDFLGTNLTWHVMPKITLDSSASVGYTHRDGIVGLADPENGTSLAPKIDFFSVENQFYETSLGLNWSPRPFLSLFAGYRYFSKDSTFKQFRYDDHKTVASVRLKF